MSATTFTAVHDAAAALGDDKRAGALATVAGAIAPLQALTIDTSTPDALREALHAFTAAVKPLSPVDRELAREAAITACKALGISAPSRLVNAAMPAKAVPEEAGSVRVAAIVTLDWNKHLALTPLAGGSAVQTVMASTAYRPEFLDVLGGWPAQFAHATEAAHRAPVLRLERPRDFASLDDSIALIEQAIS